MRRRTPGPSSGRAARRRPTSSARAPFLPRRSGSPRSRSARSTTSQPSSTRSPSRSGPAARWLHYGLTSSDVLDTALALQVREAGALLLEGHRRGPRRRRSAGPRSTARPPWSDARTASTPSRSPSARSSPAGRSSSTATGSGSTAALEGMRVGKLSGTVGVYAGGDPDVERLVCERLGLEREPAATQVIPRDRLAERRVRARPPRRVDRALRDRDPPPRSDGGARGDGAVRAWPEGLVRDAAQAQPDRRRAPLRARTSRPRGRDCRARERRALARARHLALERGAHRPAGRVPRTRLHARPLRLARRRARRRRGPDAPQPRRLARSRLQPARPPRARRSRARRETTPTASFRRTRSAPGRRSSTSGGSSRPTRRSPAVLRREGLADAFDLDAVLQHVDVLFERLAALPVRKEPAHV